MRILTNEEREEALKESGREYEELSAQLQRWQLQNPTAVIARSPFARELIQEMVLVAERVLCLEGSTPEEIERFLEILLAQLDDPPKPPGLPARPTLPQGGPFQLF
jgi:sugar-specific transcriptional regulator TrmB